MSWIKNAGGDVHLGFALLTAAGVFFWLQSWIIAVTVVCAGVACMLPAVLIGIRFKMLTEINGEEGIQLPNESLGVTDEAFKELYNHEHATGRSKQSRYGLSDFFWYGHCPSSFVLLLSPPLQVPPGTRTGHPSRAPGERRRAVQDHRCCDPEAVCLSRGPAAGHRRSACCCTLL